ncbi:MAG: ATP-binding cassette domain-containing protein [Polyangiaceae bacterium]|nr:ATP-binding cassette domain-containing protein [Polyangiaceae bacterium]
MIAFAAVSARGRHARGKPPAMLRKVNLTCWGHGAFVVIGTPADGTSLLVDVAAGVEPATEGRVSVFGYSPDIMRPRIAYVPRHPILPDALRVEEICELAAVLRSEPVRPASERLAPLGIESLAKRRSITLSPEETKAVALALALTSESASVLLLDEPLSGLAAQAAARAAMTIRSRAASACMMITTASVRDATKLADQLSLLTRGMLAPLPPALAHVGHAGAFLRVVVAGDGLSDLARALADEPGVTSVTEKAFVLVVAGPNLLEIARAVASASARTRVDLEVIEPVVLPIEIVCASLASPRMKPPPPPPHEPPKESS